MPTSKKPDAIGVTSVRIPATLRKQLVAAATREHRSLANFLMVAAMERLEKAASPST